MQLSPYQAAGYKEACERYGLQKEAVAPIILGAGALALRALPALTYLARGASIVGRGGSVLGRGASAIGRGSRTVGSKIWNAGVNIPNSKGSKFIKALNVVSPVSPRGGLQFTAGSMAAERALAKQKLRDAATGFKRNFNSAIGPEGQSLIVKRDKPQYIV